MMEVPNFADLGKSARDVFAAGYHYGKGLIKLNVKTRSARRYENDSTLNLEAAKLSGSSVTRYRADAGSLLLKWTTEGVLLLGCEFNGLLTKRVDLLTECAYCPETAVRSVKLGSRYAGERLSARCEITNHADWGTSLLGSIVMKCGGLFVGYRTGYDATTGRITYNDVALACGLSPDFDLHLRCNRIPYEYGLSVFYKAKPDLDLAANGVFAKRGDVQKWTVGAAARCRIDDASALRFKFNSDLQLGTSLQQKLNDAVTLILSYNIDCASLATGGHRVGLALNIEA